MSEAAPKGEVKVFKIAATKETCHGLVPMQCLVVNGQLFYDHIDGYQHIDGQSVEICVLRTTRPEPVPADAGLYLYQKVDC